MDSQGFRLRGYPDLVSQPSWNTIQQETSREINATKPIPAPDARYHGYSALMEDGHYITDYRPSCVSRAPPGTQFGVKQWTVNNASNIIQLTRSRLLQLTGHSLGLINTEPDATKIQKCTTDRCSITRTNAKGGIGIERDEAVPELFGTFHGSPDAMTRMRNTKSAKLTTKYEQGRNTSLRWQQLYQ